MFSQIAFAAETSVTKYFDARKGAMAINYDTELYECGMVHSASYGHNVNTAISRSEKTQIGWPNLIQDSETYGIPVSFNICGHEVIFGDSGRAEIAAIDIYQPWHSDPWWSSHTWYSDKPQNGGNYKTVGDLSGVTNQNYGLIYGGNITERAINSFVPFEISYHNFGHEDLGAITATNMNNTFSFGVQNYKKMGLKLTAEAPPWNSNPDPSRYPIYVQNGIIVFNRDEEGSPSLPYEIISNLWIVPRSGYFTATTDFTSRIDDAINTGTVLADYSHPEDGFDSDVRNGYQTSLAYAKTKVDSGELWATTLSQIGRYWEAKSDINASTQILGNMTLVTITSNNYDAVRFGIPYLTFNSSMPDNSTYAKITVDYPFNQILNSNSSTVRVANGYVVYTIYLNPTGTTNVHIEGVSSPFTSGVNINKPVLSIDSTPPSNPISYVSITIRATAQSTDAIYTANIIYQRNDDAKDSKIMTYNSGNWEANIGPFNTSDTVSYYVSVTDNSGTRNISSAKSFTVAAGQLTPPMITKFYQYPTNISAGDTTHSYCAANDSATFSDQLSYNIQYKKSTASSWLPTVGQYLKRKVIYTIGDSITAGHPLYDPNPSSGEIDSSYQYWLDYYMNSNASSVVSNVAIYNLGVGGNRCDQVIGRFNSVPNNTDYVIILCGINDIAQNQGAANVENEIETLYNMSLAKNVAPILMTIMPDSVQSYCADTLAVDNWLRNFAAQKNAILVDLYPYFSNGTDCYTNTSLFADTVHPNVDGYNLMGKIIWQRAFNNQYYEAWKAGVTIPSDETNSTYDFKCTVSDESSSAQTINAASVTVTGLPTEDLVPPWYSSHFVNSTFAGTTVNFSLKWTDNFGLDGFIFGFDNGVGSFVNDSFTKFTEGISAGKWWNRDWKYRKEITINNSANPSSLTNYDVLVTIDTASLMSAGKMNKYGGDIRFVDGDDQTQLNFWIESGINTSNTRIWVNVPIVLASSAKKIYMYYGSSNHRVPQSNGNKTFQMFDDFGGRGWEEFKYSGNPVTGPGSTGGGSATFSSVLRENATYWRLYGSYFSGNNIGWFSSSDGLHWTPQNIALYNGPGWDSGNVWCSAVWKENSTFYMLYSSSGGMGFATSPNGTLFDKYSVSTPVFTDPYWAGGATEAPCFSVLKENGIYYVMFNTLGTSPRQSGVAYSNDLIHWTPAYTYPRFPGGGSGNAWNYNTFCGNVFKYDDTYYLILPGQDSSFDYAKYGMYTSHSPLFPENDTEFKGIVFIGGKTGWDAGDMDTPWTVFYDNKMNMYYAACGSCWSQTGVALIDDIPTALTQAYPPGNYIDTNRGATASLQIMPPVGWQKSISGYLPVNSQNFDITLSPAISGRAVIFSDNNSTLPLELYKDISSMNKGIASAWMRRVSPNTGDFDLYIYGDGQTNLAAAAGLGSNGYFHYWNGAFVDTAITFSANTWYLVTVEFDTTTDKYNFVVYDTSFNELLKITDINFGAAISAGIDRLKFRTSDTFNGNGYLDDVRVRNVAATNPPLVVSSESPQTFKESWSNVIKVVNSNIGSTIRWQLYADDTSGNWNTSDVYSFVTTRLDLPPIVTQISPIDNFNSKSTPITFHASCSDDNVIVNVSLYGDWSGSWSLIDSNSSAGLNNKEVAFTKTVPDGMWKWNILCYDDSGYSSWGANRTIKVDTTPPVLTITSPANITYNSKNVHLNYAVSETPSWCGYSLNGGGAVTLTNCANTTLNSLTNGTYALTVYANDSVGNIGSSSSVFSVNITPDAWWDSSWRYRIPVTIDSSNYDRLNEPIEDSLSFTQQFSFLGQAGLTLDSNSIRVVEYQDGAAIGEVPSQFDKVSDYDATTNAAGTVVWIMSGSTPANTGRYYYIYFDSSANPKTAPTYLTSLNWNSASKILSNSLVKTTITDSDSFGGGPASGLKSLMYNNIEYLSGGASYIHGSASSYVVVIDGPVKKTIKLIATVNGNASFTLYDQANSIRVNGEITGVNGIGFTPFPYIRSISTADSASFHYYDLPQVSTSACRHGL